MFHNLLFDLVIVQDEAELDELIDKARRSEHLFWDTETTGLRARYPGVVFPVGWTLAFDKEVDEAVYYIPQGHLIEGEDAGKISDRLTEDFIVSRFPQKHHLFTNFDPTTYDDVPLYNMDSDVVINFINKLFALFYRKIKVAHNQSYDMHILANETTIDVPIYYGNFMYDDTMVMQHTVDEEAELKLEKIVENAFGFPKCDFKDVCNTVTKEEKKLFGVTKIEEVTFAMVTIAVGAMYSGEDVFFMRELYPELLAWLERDVQYEYYREHRIPFLLTLWEMERRGLRFDVERAKVMAEKAQKVLDELTYKIFGLAGVEFNLNSNDQWNALLYGHVKTTKDKEGNYKEGKADEKLLKNSFKLPVVKWSKGGDAKDKKLKNPSTDDEARSKLLVMPFKDKRQRKGQELLKLYDRYKALSKLRNTYMVGIVDEIYPDGKIRPSFNQCGTVSHRISCSNPNALNLPKPLENVKEPKMKEGQSEEAFAQEMELYRQEKDEHDFWAQFEIRSLMIPDDKENDVLIAGDFNALEKRLTCNITKEPALIDVIEHGIDAHGLNATFLFPDILNGVHPNEVKKLFPELRNKAKTTGFARPLRSWRSKIPLKTGKPFIVEGQSCA